MEIFLIKADGGVMFDFDLNSTKEQTTLDKMQRAVNENEPNGLIQYATTPFEDTNVIVNEEGLLKGYELNLLASAIAQQHLVGDAIVKTSNPKVKEFIHKVVAGFSKN